MGKIERKKDRKKERERKKGKKEERKKDRNEEGKKRKEEIMEEREKEIIIIIHWTYVQCDTQRRFTENKIIKKERKRIQINTTLALSLPF